MTFEEAMEATVTRSEARAEILNHSADWTEFLQDCGDLQEYRGATVLIWLGY